MNLLARRQLLERVRLYLRHHDLVQGYFPQLVMEEQASEWWSLLWYCVRYLDDLIDKSDGSTDLKVLLDDLMVSPHDPGQAIRLFMKETSSIVPERLLHSLYNSTRMEKRYFSNGQPQTIERYVSLIDKKSVIPVYICALLNGTTKADLGLAYQFTTGVGRAAQLLDDLFDMRIDLAQGRVFITQEEISALGITIEAIQNNLDLIVLLRNEWLLETSRSAYDAAYKLSDNNFALIARAWIEGLWKLVAEGKTVPLDPALVNDDHSFARYVGTMPVPFEDVPFGESMMYRLLHRPLVSFLRRYKVFDSRNVKEIQQRIRAELKPHLIGPEPNWPYMKYATDCNGAEPDHRIVFDLDQAVGLPVRQILECTLADLGREAFDQVAHGKLTNIVSNLLADIENNRYALEQEMLDQIRGVILDNLPEEQQSLQGLRSLFSLGFDTLSIFSEHQHAFQKDIQSWMNWDSR